MAQETLLPSTCVQVLEYLGVVTFIKKKAFLKLLPIIPSLLMSTLFHKWVFCIILTHLILI